VTAAAPASPTVTQLLAVSAETNSQAPPTAYSIVVALLGGLQGVCGSLRRSADFRRPAKTDETTIQGHIETH